MNILKFLTFFLIISITSRCSNVKKAPLRVAVASNLAEPLNLISAEYLKETNIDVEIIIGSSGKLTTQILHGAPFDIFISADLKYLDVLKAQELLSSEIIPFVEGTLILWVPVKDFDLDYNYLTSQSIDRIAIPNPELAPFGKAAREVLINLKIWDDLNDKIVFGENVTQTNQFLMTQAVQAGITSKSIIHSDQSLLNGQWIQIDKKYHQPIIHGITIMNKTSKQKESSDFIQFLYTTNSKAILNQYGYQL